VSEKMCGVADWDEIISQAEIDEAKSAIMSRYDKDKDPNGYALILGEEISKR
jgi:hypothetical protein